LVLAKPISEYETVQTWLQGLREQWGAEPDNVEARLDMLRHFCEFVERDPDGVIADCSREVEGGKRIRIKSRRLYSEKIAEFQSGASGDARAQARTGNLVRSFMIHNGIFMQAGVRG
jgi:hypothetical protein